MKTLFFLFSILLGISIASPTLAATLKTVANLTTNDIRVNITKMGGFSVPPTKKGKPYEVNKGNGYQIGFNTKVTITTVIGGQQTFGYFYDRGFVEPPDDIDYAIKGNTCIFGLNTIYFKVRYFSGDVQWQRVCAGVFDASKWLNLVVSDSTVYPIAIGGI